MTPHHPFSIRAVQANPVFNMRQGPERTILRIRDFSRCPAGSSALVDTASLFDLLQLALEITFHSPQLSPLRLRTPDHSHVLPIPLIHLLSSAHTRQPGHVDGNMVCRRNPAV